MSLIHICELNGDNPFEYLTELQKHAGELAKNPALWMPWNYRQNRGPAPARSRLVPLWSRMFSRLAENIDRGRAG
jgi:hypothetical protein